MKWILQVLQFKMKYFGRVIINLTALTAPGAPHVAIETHLLTCTNTYEPFSIFRKYNRIITISTKSIKWVQINRLMLPTSPKHENVTLMVRMAYHSYKIPLHAIFWARCITSPKVLKPKLGEIFIFSCWLNFVSFGQFQLLLASTPILRRQLETHIFNHTCPVWHWLLRSLWVSNKFTAFSMVRYVE